MAGREQIARPPRDGQSQGTVGPKGDEGMVSLRPGQEGHRIHRIDSDRIAAGGLNLHDTYIS